MLSRTRQDFKMSLLNPPQVTRRPASVLKLTWSYLGAGRTGRLQFDMEGNKVTEVRAALLLNPPINKILLGDTDGVVGVVRLAVVAAVVVGVVVVRILLLVEAVVTIGVLVVGIEVIVVAVVIELHIVGQLGKLCLNKLLKFVPFLIF